MKRSFLSLAMVGLLATIANAQVVDFQPPIVEVRPDLPDSALLYRETFPQSPGGLPPTPAGAPTPNFSTRTRGTNVLEQGWDIIRSRNDRIEAVTEYRVDPAIVPPNDDGTPGDNRLIRAHGGTIFGSGGLEFGGNDDGFMNNPFLPAPAPGEDPVGDGILFASAGFQPYLFWTEEVPAGTMSSDVNSVVLGMRNNAARTATPGSQNIHAVLKVDGTWYVHETGLWDRETGSSFEHFGLPIDSGSWATMDVSIFDFATNAAPQTATVSSAFDQVLPDGAVEAWGVYNILLENNTRFDYIEFRSDSIGAFRTPEPSTVAMMGVLGVLGALRRRV